jgi:hypothetical protein
MAVLNLGTGANGAFSTSSASTVVNTYAPVTAISVDDRTLTIGSTYNGALGAFAVNDEVMLHVSGGTDPTYVGRFGFFKISSINGSTIILDSPCTSVISNSQLSGKIVQLIKVPNFTNVTVNSGHTITAPAYNNSFGGIVVFRANNTVTLNGHIDVNKKGYQYGNTQPGNQGRTNSGGNENYSGGGGGSLKFPGGAGGDDTYGTPYTGGAAGTVIGSNNIDADKKIYFGGSGGVGVNNGTPASSGGGPGGGIVYIHAKTISFSSNIQIRANGGGGAVSAGSYGGNGGGAGGTIAVYAQTLTGLANYVFGATGGGGGGGQSGYAGSDGANNMGGNGGMGYPSTNMIGAGAGFEANGGGGGGDSTSASGGATGKNATATSGGKGGNGANVAGGGGGGGGYIAVYSNTSLSGFTIYPSPYTESVTINTAPPTQPPSITTPSGGSTVQSLTKVNITWGESTDPDGDTVKYDLEFFNGSEWIVIGKNIPNNSRLLNFIIPVLNNITTAKFRVRAKDSNDSYSGYLTSPDFIVSPPPNNYKLPNAINLDGNSAYVTFPSRIIPGNSDFSILIPFKTTSEVGIQLLMITNASRTAWVDIQLTSDGRIAFEGSSFTFTSTSYNDGKLHYLGITRSGTNLNVYVDGVLAATGTGKATDITSCDTLWIGQNGLNGAYFNGLIGLPSFWNRALTASETLTYAKEVTGNETGLIDYFVFDATTGKIKGAKSGTFGTLYGNYSWSYLFIPLDLVTLPSSNNLAKENIDHIRAKVNEFRQANGLPPYSWTDPIIIKKVTPVKAIHWNEIQTAINEVYNQTGAQLVSQTVQTVISEQIKPKDRKFEISRDLKNRIIYLVKALKNEN